MKSIADTKYLATLLGSHAEATSAVLALFLGGLAVGYAGFGAVTRRRVAAAAAVSRPPRLLGMYGIVEIAIGVEVVVRQHPEQAAVEDASVGDREARVARLAHDPDDLPELLAR